MPRHLLVVFLHPSGNAQTNVVESVHHNVRLADWRSAIGPPLQSKCLSSKGPDDNQQTQRFYSQYIQIHPPDLLHVSIHASANHLGLFSPLLAHTSLYWGLVNHFPLAVVWNLFSLQLSGISYSDWYVARSCSHKTSYPRSNTETFSTHCWQYLFDFTLHLFMVYGC
jgi:hypothetical protein